MLEILLLLLLPIETGVENEIFPENIEYCQNVYRTGENPLNQICDEEQVKRSLFINFDTYYEKN